MSAFKKTLSILLMAVMLLLLVLLPKSAGSLLNSRDPLAWFRPKTEPFSGRISVWHIAKLKPYSGSLGAWIGKYAKKVEKRHFGVYIELESIAAEEAEQRLAAGVFPDIISFPAGFLSGNELAELDYLKAGDTGADTGSENGMENAASVRAVPLAASCELLLSYPEAEEKYIAGELQKEAEKHSFAEFKAGKAPCCITDVRGAGDMQRLLSANKAGYFTVKPVKSETELVQFFGVSARREEEKRGIAMELLEQLLSEKAQAELVKLGLMPLCAQAEKIEAQYEQSFLAQAYKIIRDAGGVVLKPFK